MDYFESAEDTMISRQRALKELKDHNIQDQDVKMFFEEMGDRESYEAQDVLRWLGY